MDYATAIRASRVPVADSVWSAATGLGVAGTDKAIDARPAPPTWMDWPTLDYAGLDGIIYRLIHAIPEEALSQGWRADVAGASERDATAGLDEGLALFATAIEVGQTARQYGGCYALLVHEGVDDLRKPLPAKPGPLVAVHALMGSEAIPLRWDSNPKSLSFTRPSLVQCQIVRPGISVAFGEVHASHLVYMPGLPQSRTMITPLLGYDLPVPVVYWDAVRDLGLSHRSAAIAAMEQSMVVLRVKGGQTALGGDQRQAVTDALELWSASRSTLRTSMLTGEDEAHRLEAPLSGLDGILRACYDRLTVVEGASVTWLLGQAPGGLTTDDQASRRQTRRMLDRWRTMRAVPWLRAVYRSQFPDQRLELVFPDVDPATEAERATISATRATRDGALIASGAISPEESRARFAGDEELDLPVLLDSYDEDGEFVGGDLPEDGTQPGPDGAPVAEDLAATALNGAQVQAAIGIVERIAQGALPRESGVTMLVEFFQLERARAERLVGEIGRGFTPEAPPAPAADSLPTPTPEDRERRYAVPASVAGNARKALRWREEHGAAVQGGTATGWRRARQLAEESTVSGDDIIEIAAWFARHVEYDDPPEDAAEPWRDAGRVAGLLWGGASADRWATRARAAMGRR